MFFHIRTECQQAGGVGIETDFREHQRFGGHTFLFGQLRFAEIVSLNGSLVVGDEAGNLIEVQGTAEHNTFDRKQLDAMLDLAVAGIRDLAVAQRQAVGL